MNHQKQISPERNITRVKEQRPLFYSRLVIIIALLITSTSLSAQKLTLNYKVVNKGNNIGWVKLHKVDSSNISSIHLTSEIRRRIIFLLAVTEKQDVSFAEGSMTSSSIYRKVNDDVKMNRKTIFRGNHYEVTDEKSSERIMIKQIQYNLLSMYFKEPVNIKQVYSDTFQRFLDIEPKGNSSYKITLPDGNYNYYYYINGICSRIVIDHTLFTIEFIRI